ncbi:polyprenyl synthetase family protein [Ammonifex thiophilus]|uniref:Heptaprenyl diphosphate synthase n=1 Tax=Ammonifex thiophilus TaxID=444093 RepID=A0A3D8P5N0_9THEO|nr:polyprenyl synthetase family protein [Ammonifex thiophilus]RDV83005.1 heptaprenyl diphosphate synthase [Ammonifex thiophilus]
MLTFWGDLREDLDRVEEEIRKLVAHAPSPLREPAFHLLTAGGKRLRPALALLCAHFGHYSLERVLPLAAAVELIHMATLVHDDVIDGAEMRRGIPTVHSRWGPETAIKVGDVLFAQAIELVSGYDDPMVARKLAATCLAMCTGEFAQERESYSPHQSVWRYFRRIRRKTALFIGAACELGARVCEAPPVVCQALRQYGLALGMAFQVVDDVLDLVAEERVLGKVVGGDIRQGIATLPVIYAWSRSRRGRRLKEIICMRGKSEAEVQEAIAIVKEAGGISFSLEVAQAFTNKALRFLRSLPAIPQRRRLEQIAEFVLTRSF